MGKTPKLNIIQNYVFLCSGVSVASAQTVSRPRSAKGFTDTRLTPGRTRTRSGTTTEEPVATRTGRLSMLSTTSTQAAMTPKKK